MHTPIRLVVMTATTALVASGSSLARADDDRRAQEPATLQEVVPLMGPRGVDALGHGMTLVSEADGTFSLVEESRRRTTTTRLGSVPAGGVAPAVAAGPHHSVYVLTGGGPGPGAATLYRWTPGAAAPVVVADIGDYQVTDPDTDDLEELPTDSNPFGLAVLDDGDVVVADAGGNDVLRVSPDGSVETIARLRPRMVGAPAGLPPGSPPAGTMMPSEAVATSVAIGSDGDLYVGELRGFPATPGTSQIWRIEADAVDAVCDPAAPYAGDCTRFADGLTSIVDLAADAEDEGYGEEWHEDEHAVHPSVPGPITVTAPTTSTKAGKKARKAARRAAARAHRKAALRAARLDRPGRVRASAGGTSGARGEHGRAERDDEDGDTVYAVTLSLDSWFAVERELPGSELGGLFVVEPRERDDDGDDDRRPRRDRSASDDATVTELLEGRLVLPGGVDVDDEVLYLTGPVFGPGSLSRYHLP